MKNHFLVIFVLLPHLIWAQEHSDCVSSIEICTLDPVTVSSHLFDGQFNENVDPPCGTVEQNSTWFTFSFSSSGLFYFTITPSEFLMDIDFVVFESYSDCDAKLPVRCMNAGENIGLPIDSNCLGPTGLIPGSMDVLEPPGCLGTSDNFLAPLNVLAGDLYYLMVIDFSASLNSTYTISFVSTAELSCTPVGTSKEESIIDEIILFPNPSSDQIELFINRSITTKLQIQVFDTYGRKWTEKYYDPQENLTLNTLPLPTGVYIVQIREDGVLTGTIPFVRK